MADDVISIGTEIDMSGFNSQLPAAEAKVKQALKNMSEAEAAFGAAAEAGSEQAIAALKAYESELQSAQNALKRLAQAEEQEVTILRSGTSARMAASAELRMLEGNLQGSTRAAGAFLSTLPGIGTAMQLAFPVAGAIAALEILGKSAEAAHHLYDEYVNLRSVVNQVNKEIIEEETEGIRLSNEHLEALRNQRVLQAELTGPKAGRLQRGEAAGYAFDSAMNQNDLAIASKQLDVLNHKLEDFQRRSKAILHPEDAQYGGRPVPTSDATFAGIEIPKVQEEIANASATIRNLRERQANLDAEQQLKHIQENEKLGVAGESAEKKASELKIHAMEAGLSALEAVWGRSEALSANYWATETAITRKGSLENTKALESMQKAQAAILTETNSEKTKFAKEAQAALSEITQSQSKPDLSGIEEASKVTIEWAEANRVAVDIERQNGYAIAEAAIKAEEASGTLTKLSAAEALAALHAKEYSDRLALLQEQLRAINDASFLSPMEKKAQTQGVQNQIGLLQGQNALTKIGDANTIANQISAPYIKAFDSINQSWLQLQNKLIFGTHNVGREFANFGVSILTSIAGSFERAAVTAAENQLKIVIQHRMAQAQIAAATTVSEQMQVAAHEQAAAETQSISLLTALKQISHSAAVAAAGAYSALAGVPVIGPVIGAIAAAGTFAAVEALAAFETGGIIPNTGVALVHQGEAVLPAHLTNLLMSTANNSTTNSASQTIHFHGGSDQFKRELTRHSGHLLKSVHRGLRQKGSR